MTLPAVIHPTHSPWGASSAHRWMHCPGSIALARTVPPAPSSPYAIEGTAAHEVARQCLLDDRLNAADFIGQVVETWTVDEDMVEAVQVYIDAVRSDRVLLGGRLLVEHQFSLTELHEGLYGTNDACLATKCKLLIVYDYKHGRGVPVEVEDNPQLLYYALGTLMELKKTKGAPKIEGIELVIVQPRCPHPDGPIRRVRVELIDLIEWGAVLLERVQATLEPDAPLSAGEHCRWCPAAACCPAIRAHAAQVAAIDFADHASTPPKPADLNVSQLLEVLRKADVVEQWIRDVKAHAEQMLESGIRLPGFKLVEKRPTRRWKAEDDRETARALREEHGLEDWELYNTELKSPAQIEKLLKGREAKEALTALWEKKSTGYVLVSEDDPRPALPPPAVQDFAAFLPAVQHKVNSQ